MTDLQLSDFVYSYPEQTDPLIQTKLSAKREFREAASRMEEPVPKRGEPYPHQLFFERFSLFYDRCLIFHRTGTGKTCTMEGAAEQFTRTMVEQSVDFIFNYIRPQRTNIKRIYILTKGPNLVEELRRQLVCTCTDGKYLTDLVMASTKEAQRKKNITAAISPYYTITTYTRLVSDMEKRKINTPEAMRQFFSDCIFFVDEVQHIRLDPNAGSVQEQRKVYTTLHSLFHNIERSKVFLASATPMVDSVNEIPQVMNLILPLNQQMPIDIDYSGTSLEQLAPYFNGRVSYVRELETGARPNYIECGEPFQFPPHNINGQLIPSQLKLCNHTMSQFQAGVYQRALSSGGTFRVNERVAANFVFPDGGYDLESLRKYITIDTRTDTYRANDELRQILQDPRGMRQLTVKGEAIVRSCKDEPGNCFVYCEFKTAGGAIPLSTCFEAAGFERFNQSASAFISSGGSGGLRPYCSSGSTGERSITISKKLRYALITSSTSETRVASLLELFNSKENIDGEYLKVIIGSPIAKEGLNLANVLQVHLFGASWNQSSQYQAISRAIRSTSHVALLERAGNERIAINIRQHASSYPGLESVDALMYYASEGKDIRIRRMERIMKQCAVDCQVHVNRNVRPQIDMDFSPECDYDVCNYPCLAPEPRFGDESSYAMLYSRPLVNSIKSIILSSIRRSAEASYDTISRFLPNIPRRYIIQAAYELINSRTTVRDRYGRTCYLIDSGSGLTTQSSFPMSTTEKAENNGNKYYLETLHGIENTPLNVVTAIISSKKEEQLVKQLSLGASNEVDFSKNLRSLSLETKTATLEEAIIAYASGRATQIQMRVLKELGSYVYYLPYPQGEVREQAMSVTLNADGTIKQRRITKSSIQAASVVGPPVYVHNLFSLMYDRTSYQVSHKFSKAEGRLRIYNPSDTTRTGFRDITNVEDVVFRQRISNLRAKRIQELASRGIYGVISDADGKFRLRDPSRESTVESTDGRVREGGSICTSWRRLELLDAMYRLGIAPPVGDLPPGLNRESIILFLNNNRASTARLKAEDIPLEELIYIYRWIVIGNAGVDQLCEITEDFLDLRGLILRA
uniref:Helicase ATP-binding domain-containing protein n=1 Tax=viral metagenome TaxID=1070528 RepID=A0A6C0BLZ9_9ZZZZ